MRKPAFAYAKTKVQISCAVTAQLISAFVFATEIVQPLYFLNLKLQACSHLQWLYSPVCVGPGRNPEDRFFMARLILFCFCEELPVNIDLSVLGKKVHFASDLWKFSLAFWDGIHKDD